MSKIHKPSKSCPSNHKFVQIEALLDETNHIDVLNGLLQPKLRKSIPIGSYTHLHAQTQAPALLTRTAKDFQLSDRILVTRTTM